MLPGNSCGLSWPTCQSLRCALNLYHECLTMDRRDCDGSTGTASHTHATHATHATGQTWRRAAQNGCMHPRGQLCTVRRLTVPRCSQPRTQEQAASPKLAHACTWFHTGPITGAADVVSKVAAMSVSTVNFRALVASASALVNRSRARKTNQHHTSIYNLH